MDPSRPSDAQFDPNHFQSRPSTTKHSTITTLTDQALIAFEIEHERKRLREELNRLQSAQDDTQRSLQILDFMSLHMDKDPLLNPSSSTKQKNIFKNTNTNNHNPHHNHHQNPHQNPHKHTHKFNNFITYDENISLEYLPSNTIIRCANKQVRKISDICVGDKILSLCINTYPNGKSRNSYLPKPTKRPSQTTNTITKLDIHINGHANGLPIRPRSRTTANITVPFMLPPPVHHPVPDKKFKKPRKSMPAYISPNLIAQSVTTAVNESLMLTPRPQGNRSPKSPKTRSKSFVSTHTFYKKNKEERKDIETNHSPFDIERYQKSRSSYSNSGFTQIPGPIPSHYHRNNHRNKNRLSSLPRFNTKPMAKSQNSSPTHKNSKGHFTYSAVNLREHNNRQKKTRFSNNDINRHKRSLSIQKKNGKSNYLESVGVTRVLEKNIYQLIEITTENDFKIRCTPTHLFWICGKGWGCFDSKRRIVIEKEVALMSETRNVRIPHIIHELKTGEQLLSVGGNKYRISYINVIDRPNGTRVYGLIVNKNDCFFANDLLVKNCIL